MLKFSGKKIISIILVLALTMSMISITAHAADVPPLKLSCEPQTGKSTIYEYLPMDAGRAGTAYINEYLSTLHVRRTDLSLDGTRLPVAIEFYYDEVNLERTVEGNPYGRGWTTVYNQTIKYDESAKQFAYKNENGTWIYFKQSGMVTFDGKEVWREQTSYGVGSTGAILYRGSNAELTDYSQAEVVCNETAHTFDSLGRLNTLQNAEGANQVTITYVAGSRYKIDTITDAVGRQYRFAYTESGMKGVLQSITCYSKSNQNITNEGTKYQALYTVQNGCLIGVRYPDDNAISYAYDAAGRLTGAADVDACGYSFVYTAETNQLAEARAKAAMGTLQEQTGLVTTFERPSRSELIILDGWGTLQKLTFDGCGRMTVCDNYGDSEQQTYLSGVTLRYDYVTDEKGSVVNELVDVVLKDANGPVQEIQRKAAEEELEPSNYTETTDVYGNVLSAVQTCGLQRQRTTYTYSEDGNYLLSKTDENGNKETYHYDLEGGTLQSILDGNGNQRDYAYNALRELANAYLDVSELADGMSGMSVAYSYDNGRLSDIQYGAYHYAFDYDIWGNVLAVYLHDTPLVSYTYGAHAAKGLPQMITYGNNQRVYYSYNSLGQAVTVGYVKGLTRFQYAYNLDGSLASVTDKVLGTVTHYDSGGYEVRDSNGAVLYACSEPESGSSAETFFGFSYQSRLQSSTDEQNGGIASTKEWKTAAGRNVLSTAAGYDSFRRLKEKSLQYDGGTVVQDFQYDTDADGFTGSLVKEYRVYHATKDNYQNAFFYDYQYDGNGNLVQIGRKIRTGPNASESTSSVKRVAVQYAYDQAGQLIEAVDGESGITYRYIYDSMGNLITASQDRRSATGTATQRQERNYFYNAGGLLTGYEDPDGGTYYTLDNMGSPIAVQTKAGTCTLGWGEGRMLTRIELDPANKVEYTYNDSGLRVKKTITENGAVAQWEYVWGDNGLAAVRQGDDVSIVLYDAEGEAVGFSLNGAVYTYVKNLQGDVVRVYDKTGTNVISYQYDPWGAPAVTGDLELAAKNPCTYRGYYHDQETGYYYLQSRYYNPRTGRFLNADNTALLNQDGAVYEGNLFSYCNNNAPNQSDPTGLLGRHWYNKVSFIAGVIDVALLLIGIIQSRSTINALRALIKTFRNKIINRIYQELWKYISNLTKSKIATAIDTALTLLGASIGQLIAKALDYIDPWWGYKRNNGYIFN